MATRLVIAVSNRRSRSLFNVTEVGEFETFEHAYETAREMARDNLGSHITLYNEDTGTVEASFN